MIERMSGPFRVSPWARVSIVVVALLAACMVSLLVTGSVVPTRPEDALIFQNALLLVVLGSALLERHFTKPADSLVNSLMGVVTLLTVYEVAPRQPWIWIFGYCLFVFVISSVCVSVSSDRTIAGWRRFVARLTYAPAAFLGKARLLFSILFLFGVFTFYGTHSPNALVLVLFWGLFIAIWPLGFPELISGLRRAKRSIAPIGHVVRSDWPNIVRVALEPAADWNQEHPKIYQRADGTKDLVIPLYKHLQDERSVGTGLCVPSDRIPSGDLDAGKVYEAPKELALSEEDLPLHLGGDTSSRLLGFVIENSTIGRIRFETWKPDVCREGILAWCNVGGKKVFYQVVEGTTREEAFQADRRGFQVAVASQLGVLDEKLGFARYTWLPPMNTPVFYEPEGFKGDVETNRRNDFVYGRVPGSQIQISGPFAEFMDYHTAILGVTGSGKTELAFDLVRYCLQQEIKVICIDLTARYEERLRDIPHKNLSITQELAEELGTKLFDVETGQYGAGNEKKALRAFEYRLRTDIRNSLQSFLTSPDEADRLGIITLHEISNTKATLFITELFLTCLLHFARDSDECPRVLIVVEEAHTVMPEATTMGLGDFESKGIVGKIAQIALQGRKYGVGLLVIAQRTATVSKTVLTQCNTMITLNCFDETSLGFLSHVYGSIHTEMIANLPRLHAVVFGKGVRSERPIMVEIPYSEEKAAAGD